MTFKQFEKPINNGHLLFVSETCIPCKKLLNAFTEADIENLVIYLVDTRTQHEVAQQFYISSTPTLISLKDGQEIDRFYGAKKIEYLENYFKEIDEYFK